MGVWFYFAKEKTLWSSRITQEIHKKVDKIITVLGTTYNTPPPGSIQDMSLIPFRYPMRRSRCDLEECSETQKSNYQSRMFVFLISLDQILIKNGCITQTERRTLLDTLVKGSRWAECHAAEKWIDPKVPMMPCWRKSVPPSYELQAGDGIG